MRYNELAYELSIVCLVQQDRGIPLSTFFLTAQQICLPACSSHWPFHAKRQAGKLRTNFKVMGLTRLVMKSDSQGVENCDP